MPVQATDAPLTFQTDPWAVEANATECVEQD